MNEKNIKNNIYIFFENNKFFSCLEQMNAEYENNT